MNVPAADATTDSNPREDTLHPSQELTCMAGQLEGLIGAHWNELPARLGLDLQLLAEKLHKMAAQAAGGQQAVIVTNGPVTTSGKLAHIERELAALAGHTGTLLPQDSAFDIRNYARMIGDLVPPVAAMEERLRPPSRREAEALGPNVLALRHPAKPQPARGGNAA